MAKMDEAILPAKMMCMLSPVCECSKSRLKRLGTWPGVFDGHMPSNLPGRIRGVSCDLNVFIFSTLFPRQLTMWIVGLTSGISSVIM